MQYLRMPRVCDALGGVHSDTIYNYMKNENFPKSIRLGPRAVAWDAAKVYAWMAARKADRDAGATA